MTESFPRQQARTRNFSLGAPRSFQVAPDGSRIVFLRSQGGADPVTCLWVIDLPAGLGPATTGPVTTGPAKNAGDLGTAPERLVADPAVIDVSGRDEPPEERARRERSRER